MSVDYITHYENIFIRAMEEKAYFEENQEFEKKGTTSKFKIDFLKFLKSLIENILKKDKLNRSFDYIPYLEITKIIYSFDENISVELLEKVMDEINKATNSMISNIEDTMEGKVNDRIREELHKTLSKILQHTNLAYFQKKELIDSTKKEIYKLKEEQSKIIQNFSVIESINEKLENNFELADKRTKQLNNYEKKIDAYENKLNNYEKRIDAYENKFNNYEKRIDAYENKLNTYDKKIDAYENKLNNYEKKIDAYENELNTYDKKIDEYENKLKKSTMDMLAVIGIFSTIIFAVFGGLSQLAALGGSLPSTPTYKIFIYSGITATVLSLVVFLSFYSLAKFTELNLTSCGCNCKIEECKHNLIKKYPVITFSLWVFFSFIITGFIILLMKHYVDFGFESDRFYSQKILIFILLILPLIGVCILVKNILCKK